MSPALAGRFLTTVPPGKFQYSYFNALEIKDSTSIYEINLVVVIWLS